MYNIIVHISFNDQLKIHIHITIELQGPDKQHGDHVLFCLGLATIYAVCTISSRLENIMLTKLTIMLICSHYVVIMLSICAIMLNKSFMNIKQISEIYLYLKYTVKFNV